jgi:thioesterase domain-containing protein
VRAPETPRTLVRSLKEPVGAAAPAVYVVHPGSLPADVHQALADALPPELAVAVLDLQEVEEYWHAALNKGRVDISIEEIAARFARELSTLHAGRGPFVLVGWSFGGVLALALAERLGPELQPDHLFLLDSIAPVNEFKQPDDELALEMLLAWFAMYLGAKRGKALRIDAEAFAGLSLEEGLARLLDAAIAGEVLQPGTPLVGLRKLYDTYVDGLYRNNRLTAPYAPQPTRLPLTLVKPERSLLPDSPTLGWDELAAGGLRVETCPGDHYTAISDPAAVAQIAALVREELAPTPAEAAGEPLLARPASP